VRVKRLRTAEETFWSAVRKTDSCWLWEGFVTKRGRGMFSYQPAIAHMLAHRYSFEQANGKIPDGLEIHHKCGTGLCVRPDHLELAERDNHPDSERNKTHCPYGHPYSDLNTRYIYHPATGNTSRACRICLLERAKDNYQKRKKRCIL
jgi:HNH endonuclease